MNATELKKLIDAAQQRFDALTPEQKAAMWREQRISFVYGQLQDSAPHITKEGLAKLIN